MAPSGPGWAPLRGVRRGTPTTCDGPSSRSGRCSSTGRAGPCTPRGPQAGGSTWPRRGAKVHAGPGRGEGRGEARRRGQRAEPGQRARATGSTCPKGASDPSSRARAWPRSASAWRPWIERARKRPSRERIPVTNSNLAKKSGGAFHSVLKIFGCDPSPIATFYCIQERVQT